MLSGAVCLPGCLITTVGEKSVCCLEQVTVTLDLDDKGGYVCCVEQFAHLTTLVEGEKSVCLVEQVALSFDHDEQEKSVCCAEQFSYLTVCAGWQQQVRTVCAVWSKLP